MSTRWQVAAKLANGQCGCIYVHSDGYPSHALTLLQEHYTDQQKIDLLIGLGDCVSLGPTIDTCDLFMGRASECWDDIKPTYGNDLKAVADAHLHGDEEYRYNWDGTSWAMAEF